MTGSSTVFELKDGEISQFEVVPEDAGVGRHDMADLKGGDAAYNAAALRGVLEGDKNAYRDMVLLNSAAGLVVAGKASDLKAGAEIAAESIDSGAAKRALANLVEVSNRSADG